MIIIKLQRPHFVADFEVLRMFCPKAPSASLVNTVEYIQKRSSHQSNLFKCHSNVLAEISIHILNKNTLLQLLIFIEVFDHYNEYKWMHSNNSSLCNISQHIRLSKTRADSRVKHRRSSLLWRIDIFIWDDPSDLSVAIARSIQWVYSLIAHWILLLTAGLSARISVLWEIGNDLLR